MIDLTNKKQVLGLQANIRTVFGGPPGQEVLKFLDDLCGWYDFSATEPNDILVSHGKRQVLATIKTLLEKTPEEIITITKYTEGV